MPSMPATMSRKRKLPLGWWTLIPAVALYGVLGCSPAPAPTVAVRPAVAHDDHDHDGHDGHDDHDHAHPETLAAGLTELESMWGHVRAALAAGERDKADDKVHSVGHLLEDMHGLLAKEMPVGEAEAAGKKAIDEVFACFETLDTALHATEDEAKKIEIDEIAPRIEAAIATLKGMAKK